jgi:hypothetical protein
VTPADRLHAGWTLAQRARERGLEHHARSHIERLLAACPRATMITVVDRHPATVAWLGAAHGHRKRPLGVRTVRPARLDFGSLQALWHRRQRDPLGGAVACARSPDPARHLSITKVRQPHDRLASEERGRQSPRADASILFSSRARTVAHAENLDCKRKRHEWLTPIFRMVNFSCKEISFIGAVSQEEEDHDSHR